VPSADFSVESVSVSTAELTANTVSNDQTSNNPGKEANQADDGSADSYNLVGGQGLVSGKTV
jgi:hypothetical protein